ncbi:MAG: NACHT domain-containing NTPase [Microcoleaceae cyanobacterium]
MGRSLRGSEEGVQKVKNALKLLRWKQQGLATRVECSRQTISSFLKRKPISCEIFESICSELGLTIKEVAEIESNNINNLVLKVREIIESIIRDRCGTMRIFEMTQPIGLNDIFTRVNILEKITASRRKSINDLLQECESEKFQRWEFGKTTEEKFPGVEAVEKYRKLMIWGKPGAGKTTFLKYIAIECIEGEFLSDYIPIFVTLRDFGEVADKLGILEYIHQEFFPNLPIQDSSLPEIIREGRAIILFDGLDEVREVNVEDVIKEVRNFSDKYPANHFIITCRIAAREYTFDKFTEVEVTDFDDEQISTFANNWFKNKSVKPEYFLEQVRENERVSELATNPLLLTLLCLAFEESGDFPANRSELYKEGLDALLKKWDAKRGIQRHQVYKKLSPQRKEDLLSKIAWITFENGELFFKQKVAEKYITDYICNLPGANTDEEALQLDSEVVLRSIESQHGLLVERAKSVYSFSHLTFHEYFTAREFIVGKNYSDEALKGLVSHLTDYRWQEVFLLAVGMSSNADGLLLLMKEKVDDILGSDEKLQAFLKWVNEKSLLCDVSEKPFYIRVAYFCVEVFFSTLFFSKKKI